ncbi:Putative conserved Tim44-like domain protein [Candidatus Deianiraea vastatrix]|uniref:Conserved Tim44-like domain protein n=2 Tax=Candidatus Deianiraea vastatrix TaxID=2163644 RepID=A0A5B8XGB3_9RICK|nr:Putative conserved Tim44-like domain protein [Candidatus Deianiraea vastatrix]
MIDVVIFALIAVFVVLKLRKILGNEYSDSSGKNVVKDVSGVDVSQYEKPSKIKGVISSVKGNEKKAQQQEIITNARQSIDAISGDLSEDIKQKLVDMHVKINGFSYQGFINGVHATFERVIEGYSNADLEAIISLCNKAVTERFIEILNSNEKAEIREKVYVVKTKKIEILDIDIVDNLYEVKIKINSEQIQYSENMTSGNIASGSKTVKHNVSEIWVFKQDITIQNFSNWIVSSIQILS